MRANTVTAAPTSEQPTKIAITGLSIIAEKAVPTQVTALEIAVVIVSKISPPYSRSKRWIPPYLFSSISQLTPARFLSQVPSESFSL